MIAIEGTEPGSPEAIDGRIRLRRRINDFRPVFVVVEGSVAFLRHYQQELTEPNWVILCNLDLEVLKALGVEVIDEHWSKQQPQFDLDTFLLSR